MMRSTKFVFVDRPIVSKIEETWVKLAAPHGRGLDMTRQPITLDE